MKYKIRIVSILSLTIFSFSFFTTNLYAAPTIPNQTVWINPATANPGDAVTLNAFVYNNSLTDATELVKFMVNTTEIGGISISVPRQSARTATIAWKMPPTVTSVTASVITATDANNIEIPSLEGFIGSVTTTISTVPIIPAANWQQKIKIWWDTVFPEAELFRLNKAQYFETVRDDAKVSLALVPVATPQTTEPAVPPQTAPATTSAISAPATTTNAPVEYIVLIFATMAAFFFANQLVFYLGSIIIVYLILRFIFTRFF